MNKKVLSVLLTGLLAASSLAGCGSSASTTTNTASAESAGSTEAAANSEAASEAYASGAESTEASTDNSGKIIKVVLKTLSSDYWQYVAKGCEDAGKDLGVQVDILGATSETAYDEQVSMIETILSSGEGDAMVVAPLQSDTVATLIQNTEMPIVAIDTEVKSDKVLSFVGFDNEDMGKMGGKEAVAAAKAAGWTDISAIMIAGVQGDPTSEARLKGFAEGVTEAGGTYYTDETQYADSVADRAVNCMEGIMQSHPEGVSIIFCNNDDMAMAAARAAKDNKAYENTVFIGCGGTVAGLDSILSGEESMTVTFDGYDVGYRGVKAALDAANGVKLDAFIASEGTVVGADQAQELKDLVSSRLGN